MRKPLLIGSMGTAGIFAAGIAAGQIMGVGVSAAAANPASSTRPAASRPFGQPPPAGVKLGPRADGTVTAVSGDSITIKSDGDKGPDPSSEYQNVTTVTLSSSTKYMGGPGSTVSAGSIKVGDFIVATGTVSNDGTQLAAGSVMVGPSHPFIGSGSRFAPHGFPSRPGSLPAGNFRPGAAPPLR